VPSARGSIGEPGTANTSRPRDQRAGALGGLDDDDAERQAGNDPVAAREVLRARGPAEPHFGDRGAFAEQRVEHGDILLRIDAVLPAGEDRDGAGAHARAMRSRVDAARQSRRDDEAGFAQFARETFGKLQPRGGRISRADQRDHRPRERRDVTAKGKQRRRVVDFGKPRRIGVLATGHERHAEVRGRLHLALGLVA